MHNLLHPGFNVRDALITNTGLTVTDAAHRLGVSRITLSRLLNGHADISSEMAMRLAKFFNTSVDMWINMQAQYNIWLIKKREAKIKVSPYNKAA